MDDYIFSLIMFILGGILLIYALIMRLTKSVSMIYRIDQAQIKDKKKYAVQFSKVMALISLSFILSGAVGFLNIEWLSASVLIISFIAAIIFGTIRFMKDL